MREGGNMKVEPRIAKLKYLGKRNNKLIVQDKYGNTYPLIKENGAMENKLREGKFLIGVIKSNGEVIVHIGPMPIYLVADLIVNNELNSKVYREIFNEVALDAYNNNVKYRQTIDKIVRNAKSDYAKGYGLAVMLINYVKRERSIYEKKRRKANR